MKSAIPWVLVAALLAGVYFLYSANNEKSADLAKYAAQTDELEKLRAQSEDLKKIPAQNEEIARLRKDNTELLRLRNEVQQLREQNKKISGDLASVKAKSSQAQQAEQQLVSENLALRNETQKLQRAQPAQRTPAEEAVNACIINLRRIDGAKQAWALENKKTAEDIPAAADLLKYLPNAALPVCPVGGTYTINAVGVLPTCTIPGHELK